jgi:XTP/dITP diphosphohydrolase
MKKTQDILIATRNGGKLREFAQLFSDLPVRLRGLTEFPDAGEVEETGLTFEENASIKARYFSRATRLWTLADDSGLEVVALDGAPGVRSARYAGVQATDAERMNRLLAALNDFCGDDRRARFVCALAFQRPEDEGATLFVGKCEGRIAFERRGERGFGYDPIFIPNGYTETFGELPAEIKNRISHRARALKAAKEFLRRHLQD